MARTWAQVEQELRDIVFDGQLDIDGVEQVGNRWLERITPCQRTFRTDDGVLRLVEDVELPFD